MGQKKSAVEKSNGKKPAQGGVRGTTAEEHKAAIIKALQALQDCHPKGSDIWDGIEKAKADANAETDAEKLKAMRVILAEEFKKDVDAFLTTEKK
jgi:hypothetical protein